MPSKSYSGENYRGHRATRSSRTASFVSNAFTNALPTAADGQNFMPIGWDEATLTKCRSGVYFDIDFSIMQSITSATFRAYYKEPIPNDQVNQTCTASRTVLVCRATADYNTAAWNLSTSIHTATGAGSIALTASTVDDDFTSCDITSIVQAWHAGTTNYGLYLRMSTDTSGQFAPALTTPSSNMPAASFLDNVGLTIEYVAMPTDPTAPTPKGGNTDDAVTIGTTTAIKTFDATTASSCKLRFNFNDVNTDSGDYCQQYTIEVHRNSTFTDLAYSDIVNTTGSPTGTISHTLNFTSIPKDVDLYWRVKTADTNPGNYSPFSALQTGSKAEDAVITKFKVQGAIVNPPDPGDGGGNPDYVSTSTFARSKFRVEFYPMQDTVTAGLELDKADDSPSTPLPSFNPYPKVDAAGNWLPSAVIHDAKSVGVSQYVNSPGVFFMTLPSNHEQVEKIVPLRTFWRCCRWDEKAGLFVIAGEGLVTEISSSPNEIVVYGTDKLGMLERLVVPVDRTMIGAYYTFEDFRLDQIHDYLLPAGTLAETLTTRTVTTRACVSGGGTRGSLATITTSVAHGFVTGNTITVAGVNDTKLNGIFTVETTTSTTISYRISDKAYTLASGSAGASATVVVANYRRNAFEPFQQARKIIAGTTDVSASPGSSTYRTVTETRDIMADGKSYLKTLADFADILMSGTTDVVIIENPNIGLPADNPANMYTGIRYRHLKKEDIPSPKFWLKYGSTIRNFRYEPLQSKVASRAQVINTTYDGGLSSSALFGVKSAINYPIYDNYGLIEIFERIEDERNDLQFAANMLYNRYPNQVLEFNLNVEHSRVTPFIGYAVGDLVQVVLDRRNVQVVDKFAITGQEWIGNEDGSETIDFFFSPQQRSTFRVGL